MSGIFIFSWFEGACPSDYKFDMRFQINFQSDFVQTRFKGILVIML
jgi:hypothetical protein